MKEVNQPLSKYYSARTFYKEDIEKIVLLFKDDWENCELEIDKFVIDDLSNLDDIVKKIGTERTTKMSLTYRHYYPDKKSSKSLTFGVEKRRVRIYINDDTDTYLLGLISQLEKIISTRKGIRATLINTRAMLIGTSILTIFEIFLSNLPWKITDHSFQSVILMSLSFLTLALLIIWFIIQIRGNHNVIYLVNSQDRASFFKRNKDQIILGLTIGIIGTVIGAVLGSVITAIVLNAIYPPKP